MNGEFPDILNTPLVPLKWDELWDIPDPLQSDVNPTDVLVLSLPYRIGSGDESQLTKMLGACNLTPAQYRVLFIERYAMASWHRIREKLQPKYVLLLGVTPEQLGISALFRPFVSNSFNDCTWIPSVSLEELEQQPEAKKQLWVNGLKPVFVDNPSNG